MDNLNWEDFLAWTGPNDAVRGLQPLLPVLAELLLMQCAYFVVPNSHGKARICDSGSGSNDLGSCYMASHHYLVCCMPKENEPRHHYRVAAEMRAKEGGAGASITLKLIYDKEHVQRCKCEECRELDYNLPTNRRWDLAKIATGKRALEDKEGTKEASQEKEGGEGKVEQPKKRRSPRRAECSYLN